MVKPSRYNLRQRLLAEDAPLFGTFIKSTAVHSVEIMGGLGYDFVIIDAEHAPLDRGVTELLILAARASATPALVRVSEIEGYSILSALDDGAAGVLGPHIDCADRAQKLVAASRYGGKRGFSNSPRAGGYGERSLWEHVDRADDEVAVVAMIEDPEAIEHLDEILAVEGLDAIFIGRGDLTVAMNDRAPGAPRVTEATENILDAANREGIPVLLLVTDAAEASYYRSRNVRGFVIASDYGFMRAAAKQALNTFASACSRDV